MKRTMSSSLGIECAVDPITWPASASLRSVHGLLDACSIVVIGFQQGRNRIHCGYRQKDIGSSHTVCIEILKVGRGFDHELCQTYLQALCAKLYS